MNIYEFQLQQQQQRSAFLGPRYANSKLIAFSLKITVYEMQQKFLNRTKAKKQQMEKSTKKKMFK